MERKDITARPERLRVNGAASTLSIAVGALLGSEWTYRIIRLGLALLFLYGGLTKLADPKAFARVISDYNLVPEGMLAVVAIGLPLLETVAGLGLVFDRRGSLAAIAGMLGMFLFVLWYGILMDLSIDCGCFGFEELEGQQSLWGAFYRDVLLLGGVVPFLYLSRWYRTRTGTHDQTINP
jgi:uncharacterized membrane protein YphA (DoxX/SURF4 family)